MPEPPMMPRTACAMLAPFRWIELCQFYGGFGRTVHRHRERPVYARCASYARLGVRRSASARRSEAIHLSACGAMDCFVASLLAMTTLELSRLRRAKLSGHQAFKGGDRLEILRRDLVLRNGEVELGLDAEHEIDHVHRGQPDVDQMTIRGDCGGNLVLVENPLHQGHDPVPNIGIDAFHHYLIASLPSGPYNRSIAEKLCRSFSLNAGFYFNANAIAENRDR